MSRTHRSLLILPALALAACGGSGGGRGASGDSAAVATPPAHPPADTAPWLVRDTPRRDSAPLPR